LPSRAEIVPDQNILIIFLTIIVIVITRIKADRISFGGEEDCGYICAGIRGKV